MLIPRKVKYRKQHHPKRSGAAKGAPVCVALRTYPVRVEGDDVLIDLG